MATPIHPGVKKLAEIMAFILRTSSNTPIGSAVYASYTFKSSLQTACQDKAVKVSTC